MPHAYRIEATFTLENHDGPGVWLVFPVTAKDSEKGKLVLSAKPARANARITEIVLTK